VVVLPIISLFHGGTSLSCKSCEVQALKGLCALYREIQCRVLQSYTCIQRALYVQTSGPSIVPSEHLWYVRQLLYMGVLAIHTDYAKFEGHTDFET